MGSLADGIRAGSGIQQARPMEARGPIAERLGQWLLREWIWVFLIGYGLFVGLPWLAPVLMRMGWEVPAHWLYTLYSLFCHQLPQRSLFLFGIKPMYSLSEIRQVWPYEDPLQLRAFIGNPIFGYKVAWSDRMISMYTSLWAVALLYALSGRRWRPLPVGIFLLLALPMASFNSWMRWITGVLFGAGLGGLALPYVETAVRATLEDSENSLPRARSF